MSAPGNQTPGERPEPRRLYRSRSERMLAGVAGGLAGYYEVDVSLVRVLMVGVAVFSWGVPAILLYIACVLLIPEEPT